MFHRFGVIEGAISAGIGEIVAEEFLDGRNPMNGYKSELGLANQIYVNNLE